MGVGEREARGMPERRLDRDLGVDVAAVAARRIAGGRVGRPVDGPRLCQQPTGDVHPHRRRRRASQSPIPPACPPEWHRRPRRCTAGTRRSTPIRTATAAPTWPSTSRRTAFAPATVASATGLNPDGPKILVFDQERVGLGQPVVGLTVQERRSCPPRDHPAVPAADAGAGSDHHCSPGTGHYTVTGGCPFNSDFDSRVERTGD